MPYGDTHIVWDREREFIVWFGSPSKCVDRAHLLNLTYQSTAYVVQDVRGLF